MTPNDFKALFHRLAVENEFKVSYSRYWKESPECLVCLELQKSNFGKLYYVNFKVWIHGLFGRTYEVTRAMGQDTGNLFRREPKEWEELFRLDNLVQDDVRETRLREFFLVFVFPFVEKALSREGIWRLSETKPCEIYLLPAVRAELERLGAQ